MKIIITRVDLPNFPRFAKITPIPSSIWNGPERPLQTVVLTLAAPRCYSYRARTASRKGVLVWPTEYTIKVSKVAISAAFHKGH